MLITFQAQWSGRFATKRAFAAGDRVFGDHDWRPLATAGTPAEKKRRLIEPYRTKLAEAHFDYSLVFEMFDEEGMSSYSCTEPGTPEGLEKMKEAIWSVDRAALS